MYHILRRNKFMPNESILDQLPKMMEAYHEADSKEKSAKKVKEPLNKKLKELMSSAELEEFETDELVATFKVQERTSTNETKLLNRLQSLGLTDAIETVQRPNAAVVETMIYDGKLDPNLIADCIDTKFVEVLSVKKRKKK
jgi:hypothetical protein